MLQNIVTNICAESVLENSRDSKKGEAGEREPSEPSSLGCISNQEPHVAQGQGESFEPGKTGSWEKFAS
jgi:hypothetical protein